MAFRRRSCGRLTSRVVGYANTNALTTFAFAGNVYDSPDWVGPFYGPDVHRHSAVGNSENDAHGFTAGATGELNAIRQPNATRKNR
jgi:hypothetical protein